MINWLKLVGLIRKGMEVKEHERLSNITLRHKLKIKEQLIVRNGIDVKEHKRLSSITQRHKLKQWNSAFSLSGNAVKET